MGRVECQAQVGMRDSLPGPDAWKELEEAEELPLSLIHTLSSLPFLPGQAALEGAPGEGPESPTRGHTWSGISLHGLWVPKIRVLPSPVFPPHFPLC